MMHKKPYFSVPNLTYLQALEAAVKSPVQDFKILTYKKIWDDEYGKMGDKQIPVVAYTLLDGSEGELPIFIKRINNTSVSESFHYKNLIPLGALVPDLYLAAQDLENREILFLEFVKDFRHGWPWDDFRKDASVFPKFIDAVGRLNGIRPKGDYLAQLKLCAKEPPNVSKWVFAIRRVFEDGEKGVLGTDIADEVRGLLGKKCSLIRGVEQICGDIARFEHGVIHDDLYPFQSGKRENGDVVVFDLHDVKFGPRASDLALWLGAPSGVQERCFPLNGLVDRYLNAYSKQGLEINPSVFKKECHRHWQLKMIEMIDHWYPAAVDGKEYGQRLIAKDLRTFVDDLLFG